LVWIPDPAIGGLGIHTARAKIIDTGVGVSGLANLRYLKLGLGHGSPLAAGPAGAVVARSSLAGQAGRG
jgi:hypothetical protein